MLFKRIIYFLLFISSACFGQQDPFYSQFTQTKIYYNPGYVGSTKQINSSLLVKSQFAMVEEGRLTNQSLAIHSPINYERIGIGMTMQNDRYYQFNNLNITGICSYKIRMNKGFLSLGIEAGIRQYKLNDDNLLIKDNPDMVLGAKNNAIIPDIGSGLYYYSDRTYFGISCKHLNNSRFRFTDYILSNGKLKHLYYGMAGHNFKLSNNFTITPSMLVKYVSGVNPQGDFNCILYHKNFSAGVSFLNHHRLGFQFGIPLHEIYTRLHEKINISYSYDFPLFAYNKIFIKTHELILTFDFEMKPNLKKLKRKTKVVSPILF